ncbi:MAG: dihydroxy-acid dehydratase, partial [Acetobacteraceae bacterium]|nr:dihydroxy-acid dehydratase [Acetobacteraceae bacterium]
MARAMMKAVGFTDESLSRPQIGIAHCWIGTMPCNWNHRQLADLVAQGVRAAGGTPIEVNTIAINDGITTGTEGMKTSLISREVIADSVELVARGHLFDGLVTISGCDKTVPAMAMVLGRLNIPGLMLYSGDPPGCSATVPLRSRTPTRRSALIMLAGSRRKNSRMWRITPALARARAAANSPPIPWQRPARCWAYPQWAGTASRPPIRKRRKPRSRA